MIDIALLRNDPDLVRRTLKLRDSDVDVDHLIKVDAQAQGGDHAHRGVALAAESGRARVKSKDQVDIDAARALKDELRSATDELRELQRSRDDLWAS